MKTLEEHFEELCEEKRKEYDELFARIRTNIEKIVDETVDAYKGETINDVMQTRILNTLHNKLDTYRSSEENLDEIRSYCEIENTKQNEDVCHICVKWFIFRPDTENKWNVYERVLI